jgi:hypothetical protein
MAAATVIESGSGSVMSAPAADDRCPACKIDLCEFDAPKHSESEDEWHAWMMRHLVAHLISKCNYGLELCHPFGILACYEGDYFTVAPTRRGFREMDGSYTLEGYVEIYPFGPFDYATSREIAYARAFLHALLAAVRRNPVDITDIEDAKGTGEDEGASDIISVRNDLALGYAEEFIELALEAAIARIPGDPADALELSSDPNDRCATIHRLAYGLVMRVAESYIDRPAAAPALPETESNKLLREQLAAFTKELVAHYAQEDRRETMCLAKRVHKSLRAACRKLCAGKPGLVRAGVRKATLRRRTARSQ